MTVAVRVLYLAPMLYLQPLQDAIVRRVAPLFQRQLHTVPSLAKLSLGVVLSALSSAFVTPFCMAIFSQRSSLPVSRLEGKFDMPPATRLFFNKGL